MNRLIRRTAVFTLINLVIACLQGDATDTQKLIYAVEINGTLCGYSEVVLETQDSGQILKQDVQTSLAALGSQFESHIALSYHLSPDGGFTYHDSEIHQGQTHLTSEVTIEGQTAVFDFGDGDLKEVPLPPGTLLENTTLFPHLVRDFVQEGTEKRSYQYLEVRDAAVQKKTYTLLGRETLDLAGSSFDSVGLEQFNEDTGVRIKIWLDSATGKLLKSESPGNRIAYLADPTVKKRLRPAVLDDNISSRANLSIGDYQGITYMKVRAEASPSGVRLTEQSLSVPGQRFTGEVEENRLRGTFEIEHKRFDTAKAPPFPADFSSDEALRKYLEPGDFIESDDPELREKARELTLGAPNTWEAATRLSHWVAKNIDYNIPGGVTSVKTYETRSGECGAHSFLTAAFCRSVGIPARVVWGAMYVPSKGGVFGQHAWNEVYMGAAAGWIPIDTTANEIDYVDSGHIRLGEYQSISTALNPVAFEILDYRVGEADQGNLEPAGSDFAHYLGTYVNSQSKQEVKVDFKDGSLVVDVIGKATLALNPPDPEGVWTSKVMETLFCTFSSSSPGNIDELVLHQLLRLRKTAATVPDDAPQHLLPYMGNYFLPQANAEFTVLYDQEQLAINDPLAKRIIHLKPLPGSDKWIDEFDKNQISFEKDSEGQVSALVLDSINRFTRAAR